MGAGARAGMIDAGAGEASAPRMADERGDAFEADAMQDGARVIYRDKRVSRSMAAILAVPGVFTMLLGVFIAMTNATASKPVPAAALPFVVAAVIALGAMLPVLGVMFGVLRTVLTERALHVKYGLWGPTIPLDAVRSCTVRPYEFAEFGGWGIRRSLRGTWAYVPTEVSDVLEIAYEEGGKEKRVVLGASDPRELARRIDEARGAAGTKLRVAADATAGAEAEAEAEAEAAEESRRARR